MILTYPEHQYKLLIASGGLKNLKGNFKLAIIRICLDCYFRLLYLRGLSVPIKIDRCYPDPVRVPWEVSGRVQRR